MLSWHQAIVWTNVGQVYGHVCVTQSHWVNPWLPLWPSVCLPVGLSMMFMLCKPQLCVKFDSNLVQSLDLPLVGFLFGYGWITTSFGLFMGIWCLILIIIQWRRVPYSLILWTYFVSVPYGASYLISLTHCGLVMSYGIANLCQHWFR